VSTRALNRSLKRSPAIYRIWERLRQSSAFRLFRRSPISAAALRKHARAALSGPDPSYAGEGAHLRRLLERCGLTSGSVVDIAAGDGVTQSCTLLLFRDPSWRGLAVEMDATRFRRLQAAYSQFPNVQLARARVTPESVEELLRAHDVPARFEVLNLDLDSFDLWVADALLRSFQPAIITMEVNEKIPAPIYFTLRFDADPAPAEGHYYGCSLAAAADTVRPHGYVLESLQYNNAFFVRHDVAEGRIADTNVTEAYERGYSSRRDRRELFPWNHDAEHLLGLEPSEAVAELKRLFRAHEGFFIVHAPAQGEGRDAVNGFTDRIVTSSS
jgi:hypothetical protein